jgi:hypothetical protein
MVTVQETLRPVRPAALGVTAAVGTAVIIGVPTDVIPNPVFGRQTPVHPQDVVVLIALAVITGALAATYAMSGERDAGAKRAGIGSGVLGWLAVSCPVCNKLIVVLLGASGATSTFSPLQPALGGAAIALAAAAIAVRVRAIRRGGCQVPPRQAP